MLAGFACLTLNDARAAGCDPGKPTGALSSQSFSVIDTGRVEPGPLFIMQEGTLGASPRTGDWYYMAVAPSGAPMPLNVFRDCNACHQSLETQDYMGHPLPALRTR